MLLPVGENDFYKSDKLAVAWVSGITAEFQDEARDPEVCSGNLEEQTKKAYKNLEMVLSRTIQIIGMIGSCRINRAGTEEMCYGLLGW
jgi:hypothetical protein